MLLLGTHRLVDVQIPQVLMNPIFAYSEDVDSESPSYQTQSLRAVW